MITLTQDLNRLILHANFEKVCCLPFAVEGILHLCAGVREASPDFFSDNEALAPLYENAYAECSDLDLMVEALKEIHAQTLIEDNTAGFYAALDRYGIPKLPFEVKWGDSVDQLLDALLSYAQLSEGDLTFASTTFIDHSNSIDADFVEAM